MAAIILVAIAPLIKFREIITTLKYDRADATTQTITLLAVLFLGIEEGIALGVIVTVSLHFCTRNSLPHIAVTGQVGDSEQFRNVGRHEVTTWPNLLLIRIDENITFANITYITDFISAQIDNKPELEHVVLQFGSVSYVDITAFETLFSYIEALDTRNITVNLADVKGPVMDKFKKMDLDHHLMKGQVFFHSIDAIKALAK